MVESTRFAPVGDDFVGMDLVATCHDAHVRDEVAAPGRRRDVPRAQRCSAGARGDRLGEVLPHRYQGRRQVPDQVAQADPGAGLLSDEGSVEAG